MPRDGAFTAALLLLLSSVSALTVLPPRNVTVSCENLKTWVSWEFSEQQPSTSFRVETVSSDGHLKDETTEHQYDLTGFIWESQDHYAGFHSVNVTAIQQGGESQPVRSESFTFNKNRPAHKHCVLDFPPVDVTAGDSGNTVIFQNPFHFYTELKKAKNLQTAFFEFDISFDQTKNVSKIPQVQKDEKSICRSTEVICRYDLPQGEERCIKVKGRLYSRNRVEKVEVRETGPVCPTKPSEAHVITLSILLTVLVLIIGVLTISIYLARAWTQKTPKTPRALDFEPYDDERNLLNPAIEEVVSPVMVMKPSRTSSVSSEDGGLQDSSTCSDLHYMTRSLYMEGGLSEGGDPEAMEMMSEGAADEEPADEEQGAVGNYDRQHIVRVDLGGDTVEGYRER